MDPTGADKMRLRLPQKVTVNTMLRCIHGQTYTVCHYTPVLPTTLASVFLFRRTRNVLNPIVSSFPALDFIQLLDSNLCRTLAGYDAARCPLLKAKHKPRLRISPLLSLLRTTGTRSGMTCHYYYRSGDAKCPFEINRKRKKYEHP